MTEFFRPLALAVTLAAALPAAAQQTTQRPTIWSAFTAESLATAAVQSIIGWARFLADIRYQDLSVDPVAMRITLTGTTIEPLTEASLPGAPLPGTCRLSVDRLVLAGAPIDRVERRNLRLTLDGAELSAGCLPVQLRAVARQLGMRALHADRAGAEIVYDAPSGGVRLHAVAEVERIADITLDADLDYFSMRRDPRSRHPAPAFDLNRAELGVTDRDGLALLREVGALDPNVPLAALVSGGVEAALAQANGPDRPATPIQRDFAARLGAAVAGIEHGQRRVVVATRIAHPPYHVAIERVDPFERFFAVLNPSVGATAPPAHPALPVSELQAALDGATGADALAAGRALATGIGAPKNGAAARRILEPLAKAGDAEAALLLARIGADGDPAQAYGYALAAAAAGKPEALALMDRIERGLTLAQALAMQDAAAGPVAQVPPGDALAMRRAARGYLVGSDRPRSWRMAHYWAAMAAAADDPVGADLVAELDERMRLRGEAAAWAEVAAKIDEKVLQDWIASDVPALLQRNGAD